MIEVIKLCWWPHGQNHGITTLCQNTFILRRPRVASYTDIINIAIIFVKKIFKDSKKVERMRNYVSISVFPDKKNIADFR